MNEYNIILAEFFKQNCIIAYTIGDLLEPNKNAFTDEELEEMATNLENYSIAANALIAYILNQKVDDDLTIKSSGQSFSDLVNDATFVYKVKTVTRPELEALTLQLREEYLNATSSLG